MSELPANAFIGRKDKPTDSDLSKALGGAKAAWDQLVAALAAELDVGIQEWSSYSPKAGWSLRLKRQKRTIAWVAPCINSFRVAFVLGDKAIKSAREGGLPQRVLRMLDKAEKYPEGTALRFQVKDAKDIPAILKVAEIKIKN